MSDCEVDPYHSDGNEEDSDFVPDQNKKKHRIRKKGKVQVLLETKTTESIGKRKRNKVNRFGKRSSSSNHNDFFVSLAAKKQKLPSMDHNFVMENQLIDSNVNNMQESNEMENFTSEMQQNVGTDEKLSSFFNNLASMFECRFKELESNFNCKFETLQKQIARIEVKLNQRRVSESSANESDVSAQSYLTELQMLGFPLKSIEGLNAFEEKLNDSNHEKLMVNIIYMS